MTALAEQIGWITRLVGFDTSSGRSNLPLIEAIEDYMSGLGIASHRVASPDGRKANLYAVIGPHEAGGIVLTGQRSEEHTSAIEALMSGWYSVFCLINQNPSNKKNTPSTTHNQIHTSYC